MVARIRQKLKTIVAEKSGNLHHGLIQKDDDDVPVTDALASLIMANKLCGLDDECIVDDILTIHIVMDNLVKQVGAYYFYLMLL